MPPELMQAIQRYAAALNAAESAGAEIEAIIRRLGSVAGPSPDVAAIIAERDAAVAEAAEAVELAAQLNRRMERIDTQLGLREVPMEEDDEEPEEDDDEEEEPEAVVVPKRRRRATRR